MGRLVSDNADKGKDKSRKKEKGHFPTKIIIRRLPPSLTKEDLIKEVGVLAEHDYFNFVSADYHFGHEGFTRAYINFKHYKDVYEFRNKFDGFVFYDNKGKEYSAVVELAACQQVPKEKKKRDHKSGAIEKDADYLQFLEQLGKEEEKLPSAEIYIEEIEAAKAIDKNKAKVLTPLIEFLKEKRESRIAARQAAIMQREKEKLERIEKEKEKRREREREKEKERRSKLDDKKERRDRKSPEKSYREMKKFSDTREQKKEVNESIEGKIEAKGKHKKGNDRADKTYPENKAKESRGDRGKERSKESDKRKLDREKQRNIDKENDSCHNREKDYFSDREKDRYAEKDRHSDKEWSLDRDKERKHENERSKERYKGRYNERDKTRYFDERYNDKDKIRHGERDKDYGKDKKSDSREDRNRDKKKHKKDKDGIKEKTCATEEWREGSDKVGKTDENSNVGLPAYRRPSVEHEDPSIVSVTAHNKAKNDNERGSSNKSARKSRPEMKIYRPPSERGSNISLPDKQVDKRSCEKQSYGDEKDFEKNKEKEKRKVSERGKPPPRERFRDERSAHSKRERYTKYDRFERYDNRFDKERYDRYHVDNRRKPDRRANRYEREKDGEKSVESKGNKENEQLEKVSDKWKDREGDLEKVLSKSMDNVKKDSEREREKELEQERYRKNWLGKE